MAGPVLDSVSFDLAEGETIGILGESGAGKTILAKSLIRLLSPAKWALTGSVRFRTTEILHATERQLQKIRGAQISLMFQEPELALNPILTVGKQIDEVLRAHSIWNQARRKEEALLTLAAVGLEPQISRAYPHELSGGQRQRAAIAQSIISKPALLIADEPTSALDNVTQAAVLTLVKSLRDRFRLALLFITHNPALLNGLADRILVIQEGRIIEAGTFEHICFHPNHHYTRELLNSLPPMPGPVEHFANSPRVIFERELEQPNSSQPFPLLEVCGLSKQYVRGRWPIGRAGVVALDDVNLTLWAGSSLALVGKSGAGKSTLARCLALIEQPDSGEYRFSGRNILTLRKSKVKAIRREVQLIFQQAATAMNPLLSALDIVAEPLRIQRAASKKEGRAQAKAMLEQVGIPASSAHRVPFEFSGGQRQRIAIARALITRPKLLILDEGFSGLDVCTQAQIAKMLLELQASLSLSYLFISHDLRMAAYLTGKVAVMEKGRIVETASASDLFSYSKQNATRDLIDSIPELPAPR